MAKIKGIDISKWQGDFNFAQAKKEGQEFVIIKGGGGNDGLYVDSFFRSNYDEAKKHGFSVGSYFYSGARNTLEAKSEAAFYYENCLKNRKFDLPIFLDIEGEMLKLSKKQLTDIIETWCKELESKGFFVGIYASLNTFRSYVDDNRLKSYTHWVAQWSTECTYNDKDVLSMWQFGGEENYITSNKVAGVVCDQNYMLIDFRDVIKNRGFNGYGAAEKKVKTVEELAREVIEGNWGNGEERRERLKKAGYDYDTIQKRVNELMNDAYKKEKPQKEIIEKLANEIIRGDWGNGATRRQRLKQAGYSLKEISEAQKIVDKKMK